MRIPFSIKYLTGYGCCQLGKAMKPTVIFVMYLFAISTRAFPQKRRIPASNDVPLAPLETIQGAPGYQNTHLLSSVAHGSQNFQAINTASSLLTSSGNNQGGCRGGQCDKTKEHVVKQIDVRKPELYISYYLTNLGNGVYQEGVAVPNVKPSKEDCDGSKSGNCGILSSANSNIDTVSQLDGETAPDNIVPDSRTGQSSHDSDGKVFVVPVGAYQWTSPDCYFVFVQYTAGFDGTKIKNSVIRKIPGCKPYHHSDCLGTGAQLDRNGNECRTGVSAP